MYGACISIFFTSKEFALFVALFAGEEVLGVGSRMHAHCTRFRRRIFRVWRPLRPTVRSDNGTDEKAEAVGSLGLQVTGTSHSAHDETHLLEKRSKLPWCWTDVENAHCIHETSAGK